ncbi:Zn-dependent oxidoreductase [Gordonia paraffinivorans]|uniref:zinc-binding dehydrogenase n=1 Tax=Gordonia paraffinivorans TaxID=175628 RepID=UPI000D612475|nr:zinc-binding dehydrogenase [Gordonia paraffinivorans]MBY4575467.1 Zn-dependent oxidoreductase [Gordonia paraffinivorans]PWD41363.1 Zn-dependent oxidoreductase [Gordonia paraffinivorans]
MLSVYANAIHPNDPVTGLVVGDRPEPEVREGWTTVTVKAAALNHHDLWTLRGVGIRPEQLPMILGGDASGIDEDGNEVVVHSVITQPGWVGDDTLDPKRSLLSEVYDGTLAEKVSVPRRNLVPKPASLTFEEAACLPTAWLTAYRMLFVKAQLAPGSTVLIQGAGGGVSTASIALGKAAGLRVWVTTRTEDKAKNALALGADQVFESGARLPERVDAVIDNVGQATWGHSLKSLKPGGAIVTCGATSGPNPPSDLNRVFFLQLRVIGSTMGTRDELEQLLALLDTTGLRPQIDSVLPLADAEAGMKRLASGEVQGKIVLVP